MNSITRRSLLAAIGVTVAAGSSSCSKSPDFLNNSFLAKVASAIGVEVKLEITFGELKDLFGDLASRISSKWGEWRSGGEIANCTEGRIVVDDTGHPTIVVASYFPAYVTDDTCGKRNLDPTYPLNQSCAVFFDTANDAILLPGWAWQTLLMFVEHQKTDKEGAVLKQTEQLLRVSLCPTSSHVEEHETLANVASIVSWQTRLGPVDIGRIEKSDHTYKGIIKVSGFPDENGSPMVFEEDIPTSLSTESDEWWS